MSLYVSSFVIVYLHERKPVLELFVSDTNSYQESTQTIKIYPVARLFSHFPPANTLLAGGPSIHTSLVSMIFIWEKRFGLVDLERESWKGGERG